MNAIEQAIKEAVENGFDNQVARDHLTDWRKFETLTSHDYGWIFNRPEFWQALGKARGWGKKTLSNGMVADVGRDGYINVWQSYWHDFIDHLAEGKDAESFFAELLR